MQPFETAFGGTVGGQTFEWGSRPRPLLKTAPTL